MIRRTNGLKYSPSNQTVGDPIGPKQTHKTPITTLSAAAPLGVNALKSGKISRELVLAGNSGYHCNLLTSSMSALSFNLQDFHLPAYHMTFIRDI
jgi:hypothetical protein